MAKGKKEGEVALHMKFYPEKFASHRELIELLKQYQKATGLGQRDAFAMMILNSAAGKGKRKKAENTRGQKNTIESGQTAPEDLFSMLEAEENEFSDFFRGDV